MARNIPLIGALNLKSLTAKLTLPAALQIKNCRHCGAIWIAAAMLPFAVYGWLPSGGFSEVAAIISEQVPSNATVDLDIPGTAPITAAEAPRTTPTATVVAVTSPPARAPTPLPVAVIAAPSTPSLAAAAALSPASLPPIVKSVETAALPENSCGADFAAILTNHKLTFGFDSAKVLPENGATLDQLAAVAKRCDAFDVRVDGHTDLNGTAAYNQKLSEQRAEAVRKELLKRGVTTTQISSKGFGSSKPLSTAKQASVVEPGNRRIEFTVTERATR